MRDAIMGEPLRIMQINSLLRGGGTDDQCVKLAKGLLELGHSSHLAGPDGLDFSREARDAGIHFHSAPTNVPARLRFILHAAKCALRERIQVVHGHHGRDLWTTILVARLSRVRPKVVLTRHLAKSPSSWFSRKYLLGQCDAMIAVSHFVAKVLREGVFEPDSPEPERRARPPLHGDHSKIHVVYGGIDADRFMPADATRQRLDWGLNAEHFAFGVVGSYDLPRGKGQREFLEAAAMIHQQVPQARFLIIGRGNMKDLLEGDIERLGLRGKAWLTPYCRDMPAAMNALDCMVHCQVGTEAFGLVVCEALACGKPVIASALDGIPEAWAVASYGRLLPPEDVGVLARALREQTAVPKGSRSASELHEQVANGFSIRAMASSVAALYKTLLDK